MTMTCGISTLNHFLCSCHFGFTKE